MLKCFKESLDTGQFNHFNRLEVLLDILFSFLQIFPFGKKISLIHLIVENTLPICLLIIWVRKIIIHYTQLQQVLDAYTTNYRDF